MQLYRLPFLLLSALVVLPSCVTRGDIEEIKEAQKKILAQLEKGGGRPNAPQAQQQPQGPDPAKVYGVPAGDSAAKGAADAWVTLIEVSDFQCPYCSRVVPTIKELKERYGDDLRVVFKHNPLGFHNRAKPAAKAAECAREQGKFWEMHDALFAGQKELEDQNLEAYAKNVGVDVGRWKSCYTSNKYEDRITNDQRTVSSFGARGTPAFFINGRFLSGAQPTPAFQAIIDAELEKAKKSGMSKKEYYAKAVEAAGAKSL
jgi:protein-disulfide isomerase